MKVSYPLQYTNGEKVHSFRKLHTGLHYERQDGKVFTLSQMNARYEFIRQERKSQTWVRNINGFNIRITKNGADQLTN